MGIKFVVGTRIFFRVIDDWIANFILLISLDPSLYRHFIFFAR